MSPILLPTECVPVSPFKESGGGSSRESPTIPTMTSSSMSLVEVDRNSLMIVGGFGLG